MIRSRIFAVLFLVAVAVVMAAGMEFRAAPDTAPSRVSIGLQTTPSGATVPTVTIVAKRLSVTQKARIALHHAASKVFPA